MNTSPFKTFRTSQPPTGPVSARWTLSMILAVAFLIVLLSPFVSYVAHGLRTAWLVFAAWLLIALTESRRIGQNIRSVVSERQFELVFFVAWLVLVGIAMMLERGYTGQVHFQLVITIGMILIMEIFYTACNNGSHTRISRVIIFLLGLETLRSLPTMWSEPMIVRTSMLQGYGAAIYSRASESSVGEYNFYTGLAIGMPVMLALTLQLKGIKRFIYLASCGVIGLTIFSSTLMGATLLMLVGISLFSLIQTMSSKQKLRWASVFLVIMTTIVLAWIWDLSTSYQGQAFANKLTMQIDSIIREGLLEGDLTNRSGLWEASYYTFLENPIFGVGPVSGTSNPYMGIVVGGHSSWLDLLAEYGLFGAVFYVGFLFHVMRRVWKAYRQEKNLLTIASLVTLILYVLVGSYNPIILKLQANVMLFFLSLGGTFDSLNSMVNAEKGSDRSQPNITAGTPRRIQASRIQVKSLTYEK